MFIYEMLMGFKRLYIKAREFPLNSFSLSNVVQIVRLIFILWNKEIIRHKN